MADNDDLADESKKKSETSGITREIGKISPDNEVAKRNAETLSEYEKMRKSYRNLAQSGISQAFGTLLPKKVENEDSTTEKKPDET